MATSVKVDDALKSRVQRLAGLKDRSTHWVMRDAIRQHVERAEAQESFRQEALVAWASYKTTGLHFGAEEVQA